MPKIRKPDGHKPFRFQSRAQYDKDRARRLGRRQDWTLTSKRERELREAVESTIEPSKALAPGCVCPTCGCCFLFEARILTTADGRIHHASHKAVPGA